MRRILWEITTRCNLRCRHCYLHSELEPPNAKPEDELNTKECLSIVEQLDEAKVFLVEIVGGGEPFVRPDMMMILRQLAKKKFWTRIVTNGTLIDTEIAQNLADICINKVSVSLESSNAKINDAIRGKGSFKRAILGINNLRDFGVSFRIQMTVNKMNYKGMEDMVKFCRDIGAEEITICPYVNCPSTNPFSASLGLGREEYFSAAKKVNELKKKYSSKFIYSDIDPALIFLSSESKNNSTDKRFHRCDCINSELTILYNGNVLPCPLMRSKSLGNLMTTHLSEIPKLSEFQEFKKLLEITVDEANEQCSTCEWRYVCGGGCRGRAYLVNGDFMAPDPHMCLLAKDEPFD